MENAHSFALMLENVARRLYPTINFNADAFEASPKATFDKLLQYLEAEHLIDNEDYNRFLEEYDFGEGSLREYLTGTDGEEEKVEKMEELIGQLNCIIDARED